LKIIIISFFFILSYFLKAETEHCFDYLLLDGSEQLVSYGLDTTNHWWAVTQPFEKNYRLIIDGFQSDIYKDLKQLTFSPDGERWACFAKDNSQWYLLTNDTIFALRCNDVGEIQFSPNSEQLIYSFFESNEEFVIYRNQKIRVFNRESKYFVSNNAEKIAWISKFSDGYSIVINGTQSDFYDGVNILGFWNNGELIYSRKIGDYWELYKGNQGISDIYSNISEYAINLKGNVAAALCTEQSGMKIAIIISDEYWEPLISNRYENCYNLTLHPELPMVAYNAVKMGQEFVVFNNTEYAGGIENTGFPQFTYDGSEIYYLGCDLHCFVNVNGKKFPLNSEVDINKEFARKPNTNTIAYSTSTSLVIRNIENNMLYSGIMVDEITAPRYNWREDRYEALGVINNRLYLMTCKF